ncbi:coat protein [ssRNA phage SRR6960551_6]|uniref:Coat protein n=1 Tax=ssRNA phage SRR6960551_6 TaxID=2786557 RepID=A0A8S5KZ84_9VIRU|nr:coat protein [ssRNA phage SRR6960551_6]DAD51038.1 TPA_asm: coat protein [ssRNA phage SRR6960551_6]
MTQLADISILDGTASPVARSFVAMKSQNGNIPSAWYYKPVTQPIGWVALTHSMTQTSQGAFKLKVKVSHPQVDDTNASNVVLLSTCIASCEVTFPPNTSDTDRANTLAFMANFLTDKKAEILSLTPYY